MFPIALLHNIALILAAALLFDVVTFQLKKGPEWLWKFFSGLILGTIGVAVMMSPWKLVPGVVFDTRSILISNSGLFFGAIPTLIAVIMTTIFRIIEGGAGIYMGIAVIASSATIGLSWRYFRKRQLNRIPFSELYLMGLAVHAAMLAMTMLLPKESATTVLRNIALPVIIFYPVCSALFSGLLTSRLQHEKNVQEIAESRETLTKIIDNVPCGIFMKDAEGCYQLCNKLFAESVGLKTPEEVVGKTDYEMPWPKEEADFYRKCDTEILQTSRPILNLVEPLQKFDGERLTIETSKVPLCDTDGKPFAVLGIFYDITDKVKHSQEQQKLKDQLNHALKMESIGRLAGGVAHDFNNTLGVILGFAELTLNKLQPQDPLYNYLQEIQKATERSTDLTRQLLAFARKQTTSPKILDLNKTLNGMLKMLRRLIGESVELLFEPAQNLASLKIDPSQLDQILANLCVNARDAIDGKGEIIIKTSIEEVGVGDYQENSDASPGEFVVLEVTDNGHGMPQDVVKQIFEPFFTTKDNDKGTGLGMATVYGIVKQNDGFIEVLSQPKKGTTFKIFLPACHEKPAPVNETEEKLVISKTRKTILLVEDDLAILQMTSQMLDVLGYKVFTAATPGGAQGIAKEHGDQIDLVMTDVVMPEMNGKELIDELRLICPRSKTLYMSGYTADIIAKNGILEEGIEFIKKPFQIKELSAKLHKILN